MIVCDYAHVSSCLSVCLYVCLSLCLPVWIACQSLNRTRQTVGKTDTFPLQNVHVCSQNRKGAILLRPSHPDEQLGRRIPFSQALLIGSI